MNPIQWMKSLPQRLIEKAISDVIASTIESQVVGQPSVAPRFDPNRQLELYKSWAYVAANKNADKLASLPLRLYATRATGQQRAGAKYGRAIGKTIKADRLHYLANLKTVTARVAGAEEVEEIIEHPFIDLMQSVNPRDNQFDLINLTSLYLDNTGDSYWYLVGGKMAPISEVWVLPSQLVRIVPDEANMLKGYLYGRTDKRIALSPDEVVHFRRPSLTDFWYGMSCIEGMWASMIGNESFDKYEYSQTEARGLQQFVLQQKKGTLNPRQRRDLQIEFVNALKWSAKNKAPLISDGEVDVKPVEWSPREIGFLQGRVYRKSEIISAYGQTEALYDKNSNTANIEGAIYLWTSGVISAQCRRIEQKINERIMPLYDERLFVAFDDCVSESSQLTLEQEKADLTGAVRTVNEIRAGRGLDPVPWGDKPLVGLGMAPLDISDTEPEDEETDLPELGETSNEDMGNGDESKTLTGQPSNPPPRVRSGSGSHLIMVDAEGKATVTRTGGSNPPLKPYERQLKRDVAKIMRAQSQHVAKAMRTNATQEVYAIINDPVWKKELADKAQPYLIRVMERGAKDGARKIGIKPTFYIDNPKAIEAAQKQSLKFARALGKATEDGVRNAITSGLEDGLSIPEIADRVQSVYSGWQDWKAEMIARTETSRALMQGAVEQWKESGVVVSKRWHAAGDSCPFCADLDGTIIPLDDEFIGVGDSQEVEFEGNPIRLSHNYLPVEGGDAHPNCRCVLLPVLDTRG